MNQKQPQKKVGLNQNIEKMLQRKLQEMQALHRIQKSIRINSAHTSGNYQHVNINKSNHMHHMTYEEKPQRKVCFKVNLNQKKKKHQSQKIKFILDSRNTIYGKQKLKFKGSLKTFKSLDSSFVCLNHEAQQTTNRKSTKSVNINVNECKLIVDQILKKLQIFQDTNISQTQMFQWVEAYFQKEKAILNRIFIKNTIPLKQYQRAIRVQLERDKQVIYQKLQMKHRDSFKNTQRFITESELFEFSSFLQTLYAQKSKIKLKQIQETINNKMSYICNQIRSLDNSEYFCISRKKPNQISNFICDLNAFENNLGSLKRVTLINRNRFKLLNDTDVLVYNHAENLNKQLCSLRKSHKNNTTSVN